MMAHICMITRVAQTLQPKQAKAMGGLVAQKKSRYCCEKAGGTLSDGSCYGEFGQLDEYEECLDKLT